LVMSTLCMVVTCAEVRRLASMCSAMRMRMVLIGSMRALACVAAGSGDGAEGSGGSGEDDPLYQDAVKLVVEFGKASTSLLQRRLRIGYGRAAHLIDLMEQDGIVGAADGPKPREVLKRPDWISEIEETMR